MPTELFGFGVVPLLVGLVEIAKQVGIPSKFAPVAALAAGLLAGFAVEFATPKAVWIRAVVYGVAYGLAASGLYSGIAKFTEPSLPLPASTVGYTTSGPAKPTTIKT